MGEAGVSMSAEDGSNAAPRTCGEAILDLLEDYGVDTVFGIPGYHNLEIYRGLPASRIRHVLTRNEQGAGFMADGYARSSGRPGVCTVISGPGVTNVSTAVGQAYADSVPLLIISSSNASPSLGKGWGCLHETANQQGLTEPITAFSKTALSPDDVPELIGQAFARFASGRPRPVHVSVPLDVLAAPVAGRWSVRRMPERPLASRRAVAAAADALMRAERPAMIVGGGAADAGACVRELAEWLDASVIATNAGKGVVPDSHPLSLGGGLIRPEVRAHLAEADVVLALGTELAATDSFVERLPIGGRLIRVDIDPSKFNDAYPADECILGDAGEAASALLAALDERSEIPRRGGARERVAKVRRDMLAGLNPVERQHKAVWDCLRAALPEDAIVMGDITQIVYTGSAVMPVELPRRWFYPAGFGTLGCALPDAIGAKIAQPEVPVVAVAGDAGFMFTVQELMTAAEMRLPIPVIVWNNDGYGMIRVGMDGAGMERVADSPMTPDFPALAAGFRCHSAAPQSAGDLATAVREALRADAPTLIVVNENAAWVAGKDE